MYSKIIIITLSVLLVLSIGISLFLFKDNDYYLNLQIGRSNTAPTPTLEDDTPELSEETVISPSQTPTDTPTTKKPLSEYILIPIKDSNGITMTEIVYNLVSYEFRNEIVVQGKRASAIEGREFLLITIEVSNRSENEIDIDTRDYLRLSVNDGDWQAPETHNDPVVVQPLSTKDTRVGFIVNITDNELSLKLGGIEEEGKVIKLEK